MRHSGKSVQLTNDVIRKTSNSTRAKYKEQQKKEQDLKGSEEGCGDVSTPHQESAG